MFDSQKEMNLLHQFWSGCLLRDAAADDDDDDDEENYEFISCNPFIWELLQRYWISYLAQKTVNKLL